MLQKLSAYLATMMLLLCCAHTRMLCVVTLEAN